MAKERISEESVASASQVQIVQVLIDMDDERVLQFNSDDKVVLQWDVNSFRELPPVVEKQLRYENLKEYIIVQQKVKEKAQKATSTISGFETPRMAMQDIHEYRLKIRERKGWHGYWAAPGPDLDMRMAIGAYKQVHKKAEKKGPDGKVLRDSNGAEIYEDVQPGYENGEVLKIVDSDGKVELVALECPIEFYQDVVNDMSSASVARYSKQEENFAQTIAEKVNGNVKQDHRIKVYGGDDAREIRV